MDVSQEHTVQSVKRPREAATDNDVVPRISKRPRTFAAISGRRHAKYQRYPKPPYTYLGMMVQAVQSTPDQRLTLSGIQDALSEMFPFFQGQYKGWKDSVRHNLSHNACFLKTTRKQTIKNSSGCYWAVDLTLVPADAFKRGRLPKDQEEQWAPTLSKQLQVPEVQLPPPRTPPKKTWTGAKRPTVDETATSASRGYVQFQTPSPSLSYSEAQYTRYLREQTPDNTFPLSQYPAFASLLYDTVTSDPATAASNLNRLCPYKDYVPLCHRTVEPRTPHLRHPSLGHDSPYDNQSSAAVTPSVQYRIKVEDTPSPCIAPTNEDPFPRYFSDFSTLVFPDSLLNLSLNAEQTISGHHQTTSDLQTSPLVFHPKYEAISPAPKKRELSQSYLEATLPDSITFVPPAPPSECSTISYMSECSRMSGASNMSTTLSRDTTLPLTDFSTVSFQDHNNSSLSDLFA